MKKYTFIFHRYGQSTNPKDLFIVRLEIDGGSRYEGNRIARAKLMAQHGGQPDDWVCTNIYASWPKITRVE